MRFSLADLMTLPIAMGGLIFTIMEFDVAPAGVTDLHIAAVTDTSAVLEWTEARSNVTGVAKYVIRGATAVQWRAWTSVTDITYGGCAAPVYGSTAAGGRIRSCVTTRLSPNTGYTVQLAAYTGTLNVNAVFGPLSNSVNFTTGTRVGPMLVTRPRMYLDTIAGLRSVTVGVMPPWEWPTPITVWLGDYAVTLRDSAGTPRIRGHLLLVAP